MDPIFPADLGEMLMQLVDKAGAWAFCALQEPDLAEDRRGAERHRQNLGA